MTPLIFIGLFGFTVFTANAEPSVKSQKVVTTFTVIADIARNVAGSKLVVESVTKAGAEIHDYQPTPQDIVRARSANAILWNGLNLERWFERFFGKLNGVRSFVISEGIQPLSIYEGPYSGKPNPHAWMSPDNALIYVENIRKAFTEIDPTNAALYSQNATAYSEKIRTLKNEILKSLASVPKEQRYLVTSEGAFSYFARDFNLKELYLWPINAEQQGTPQQIRKVIDRVRSNKIPVVFSESTVSDRPAKQVASETGALYGGVLYVDSLSEATGPVPSYLDLLRTTSQTVVKGFQTGRKGLR
jgi:manganese/iron transport system substrate-binding protein